MWQRYVGAVVFTSVDDEGETLSLCEGQVEALVMTARVGGAGGDCGAVFGCA